MSWQPTDALSQDQYLWIQKAVHQSLRKKSWGQAITQAALLLFGDAEPAKNRVNAACFLALSVHQNGGSLDGTEDALRFWAERFGRRPRISAQQVTRVLRDAEQGIRDLEHWFGSVYRALWDLCFTEHRRIHAGDEGMQAKGRVFTVLQIDENQRIFQGRGSKAYFKASDYRAKARTKAGKAVVPLKPGRSFASYVGHEFLVMSETIYPVQTTLPLKTALRDPVRYDSATEVQKMLRWRESFDLYPDLVMLDAGFCNYAILEALTHFCRRAHNRQGPATKFWMPAIKNKSRKDDLDLDNLSDDALNGVYDVIMREWNRGPTHVPETGLLFSCVPRRIKDSGGLSCNLVIFYRIRKSARKKKALDFDKDVWISAFFSNEEVTVENAERCAKLYTMRWNAENLYQKLGKILGYLPSDNLHERVLAYGYSMASMGVYALHRINDYRRLRVDAADENAELTRLRSFFLAARRDLEQMLDAR